MLSTTIVMARIDPKMQIERKSAGDALWGAFGSSVLAALSASFPIGTVALAALPALTADSTTFAASATLAADSAALITSKI